MHTSCTVISSDIILHQDYFQLIQLHPGASTSTEMTPEGRDYVGDMKPAAVNKETNTAINTSMVQNTLGSHNAEAQHALQPALDQPLRSTKSQAPKAGSQSTVQYA